MAVLLLGGRGGELCAERVARVEVQVLAIEVALVIHTFRCELEWMLCEVDPENAARWHVDVALAAAQPGVHAV